MNVPNGYRELMEAVESLPVGTTRVVFLGAYPGKTDIIMTSRGPVAVYPNGNESGLTTVYLSAEMPPKGWSGLSENEMRRAIGSLKPKA